MIRRKTAGRAAATFLALACPVLVPSTAVLAQETRPTLVDSVIVTARPDPEEPPVVARARRALSQTPGAVAVVSAESYARRFAPGLPELVRDVPGVYAQRKWGGDARLAVRGSGIGNANHNRGVILAQDGVPMNEADGFGDTQMVDPLLARHTEVYKGGNALRFGGAMLGGAINIVTPTGRNAGFRNLARLEAGSYGTVRAHAQVARVRGDHDILAAATGYAAEGWREHSEGRSQTASLSVGRRFGEDREARLILSGGYVHQDIPGSLSLVQALADPKAAAPANVALNYQRDQRVARAVVLTRWRLSDSAVLEGGLYASWKDLDHPIFQVIDQESRNWGGFARLGWDGALGGRRADAFLGLYLRRGDLDAVQWVNAAGSKGARTAQSRQNAAGLDVFGEGRLFVSDRLALVAGGSWGRAERDHQSFRLPGVATAFASTRSVDYDWFAPRLGLLWEAEDGAQVFVNATRSIEPPNFSALSPTVAGFTALKPQEAWTAEIGTRGRRGAFTWDLALYRAELSGELLNYTVNPGQGVPAATFNAGRTIHQGAEAGLDWRPTPRWRLRQTYMWSDFRFRNDVQYGDNRLPVVPEHLYRAEIRYDHPSGWFAAVNGEWSPSGLTVDYMNTLSAPSYAVAGLNGGVGLGRGVELFAELRNLADERYVSNATAVVDARTTAAAAFFPGEGRSLHAGLSARF